MNAARDEMNSKIECLLQEMRSIKMLIGGESPYKQFKKIKSTNMLNSFVESMKADEKKMSLVSLNFEYYFCKIISLFFRFNIWRIYPTVQKAKMSIMAKLLQWLNTFLYQNLFRSDWNGEKWTGKLNNIQ